MLVKKSLINNWALAVTNIAIEEKKVQQFLDQSTMIIEILKENPDFVSLLSSHQNAHEVRLKIIDSVFDKKEFDVKIINTLKLIADRELFFHAREIFKLARKKMWEIHSVVYGVVWSVSELDSKTVDLIEKRISKQIKTEVKLINKIDKSLIGGVQVVVKGQKFDGSIKGKLDDIKRTILNTNIIED